MGASVVKTSTLETFSDRWSQPSYEVRVRGTTFLWGSAGIAHNLTLGQPIILHLRNDVFGDPVTVGTRVATGVQTTLGTLEPGECVSIPLQGISGVFATCAIESTIACLVRH
jgi:hypothetical protein